MRIRSDVGKSSGRDQENQHRSYKIEILNRDTGRMEAKVVDPGNEHLQAPEKLKNHLGKEAKDFVRRSGMARENIDISIKEIENPAMQMVRGKGAEMEKAK